MCRGDVWRDDYGVATITRSLACILGSSGRLVLLLLLCTVGWVQGFCSLEKRIIAPTNEKQGEEIFFNQSTGQPNKYGGFEMYIKTLEQD